MLIKNQLQNTVTVMISLVNLDELLTRLRITGESHFMNLSTNFIYRDARNITILSTLSTVRGQRSVHWITATQG